MAHKIKRYGWKPSLPDHRDLLFKNLPVEVTKLPKKRDLSSNCSPVDNQGELGSCTAHALAGAVEYNEKAGKLSYIDVSRLFIYYNERVIEGTVDHDAGAQLKDGIKSLATTGVCSEAIWPYHIDRFKVAPPLSANIDAGKRKIISYYRVVTLNEMKTALANGHPFVLGFSVYESFEGLGVAKTGIVNLPDKSERLIGGHAVLAVGYDDATKRFLIRNSWGNTWGQKGYFTIPYTYLSNPNLADDMWVIIK